MEISDRIYFLRDKLQLSQEAFGSKIGVTKYSISSYENGKNTVKDRVIADISREFNVNEEWLRYGTGEMFFESDTFSLDEYVKAKGATDFELKLIKSYFDIPEDSRNEFMNIFKNNIINSLNNEIAATKEENIKNTIDKELDDYRQELEAEQKGGTSSVSEKPKGA